jgi:hypothetical protein
MFGTRMQWKETSGVPWETTEKVFTSSPVMSGGKGDRQGYIRTIRCSLDFIDQFFLNFRVWPAA